MKKYILGNFILGTVYIFSLSCSFGPTSPKPTTPNKNGETIPLKIQNKYGETIPLQYGGGYNLTEEPIQDFIDEWKLADTNNYLKGGFAYPIGGWFEISYYPMRTSPSWKSACENCNETPVIKLNPDGTGKMYTYTEVYDNSTSRIIASAYPADTPNCLDEKLTWNFNKSTGELKMTLLKGNQSEACYRQLDFLISQPFKRNPNGVWMVDRGGNENILFPPSGRDFGK